MKSVTITKILATATTFVGAMVIFGWIANIDTLKSILPTWVTMKFSTALCFFLSGLLLFSLEEIRKNENSVKAQILLPICTLIMAFLMGALLVSTVFQINLGIESLFVKEAKGAIKSVKPGIPSIGTMVAFLTIVLLGLLQMFKGKNLKIQTIHILGWIVALAGGLAISGYMGDIPLLYYSLEGVSTAMAFHTALLFVLLGVGLLFIKNQEAL